MNNYVLLGDNRKWLDEWCFWDGIRGETDVIYLDPPYNTGSLKSYRDTFSEGEYWELVRFYASKAGLFLKSTGVLFVSVDDSSRVTWEVALDSHFGTRNKIGVFITHQAQRSNAKHINVGHEYILCYAKDKSKTPAFRVPRKSIPEQARYIRLVNEHVSCWCSGYKNGDKYAHARELLPEYISSLQQDSEIDVSWLSNYRHIDDDGRVFYASDLSMPGKPRAVDLPDIGIKLEPLETRGWASDKMFRQLHAEGRLHFMNGRPYKKFYLDESYDSACSVLPFYSRQGSEDLKRLGLAKLFDTAKPVALIKYLVQLACPHDGVVMDWFAGSGTTGQAVVELNREQGSGIRYVLIQNEDEVNPRQHDVLKACGLYGVKPRISEILIRRLAAVYQGNPDYSLVTLDDDGRHIRLAKEDRDGA